VYLTGGGLAHIRGAKEIISKKFGRPVEIVLPNNIVSPKPEQSSAFGLLELALKHVRPEPATLWDKIFKKDK
jgi:cell division ATPase FtsA